MPTGTELKYNVPHQNENITYHCPFKTLEHYICYTKTLSLSVGVRECSKIARFLKIFFYVNKKMC